MRLIISCALCIVLFFSAPNCLAGSSKRPAVKNQKPEQVSVVKPTTPVAVPPIEQLNQIRWNVRSEDPEKDNRLRLILDVSGPVEVNGAVVNMPAPYLVVNINGAVIGAIDSSMNLDGQLANCANISSDGKSSKLMIELGFAADNSDCRIFTLPAQADDNKPFRIIIDICEPAPPPSFSLTSGLTNKVIVIDPGHGGSDTGAIGSNQNLEKTISLAVAQKLEGLLDKAGARVVLTRRDDRDVYSSDCSAAEELQARVDVAEFNEADVFLSIHANASINAVANGTSTFYYKKTSLDALLAQNIQSGIVQAGGLRDRSFFPANFYVVKRSNMTAALVELAFLSNPNEERLLIDPQFQEKMAQGIVRGLERFFDQAAKRKILQLNR